MCTCACSHATNCTALQQTAPRCNTLQVGAYVFRDFEVADAEWVAVAGDEAHDDSDGAMAVDGKGGAAAAQGSAPSGGLDERAAEQLARQWES